LAQIAELLNQLLSIQVPCNRGDLLVSDCEHR
jgi:hypothetical protein